MKLAIRVFAFAIAMVGLTAMSLSTPSRQVIVSSQAAHSSLPTPVCAPRKGCVDLAAK